MKTALVHDYLIQMGGAERVVSAFHEIFPQAPIYTSVYRKNKLIAEFNEIDIHASFLQNFPFMEREFRIYFLLYPFAFSSFDLSEFDLIISSSSAYAKGIKKRKGQIHVCYCHTPMRFAWNYENYISGQNLNPLLANSLPFFVPWLKKWDIGTVKNVDYFIANSAFIAQRIRSIYKRDSVIIYPPVDTERFKPSSLKGDYFLIVSRLLAYKRLDLAVKAFTDLGMPLKIAGIGPDYPRLKAISGETIEFLGLVPESELEKLYSACRALIFPGEEDFGLTPLEAAASGKPTIAFDGGGARETVIDGETGIFFKTQDENSLIEAVKRFDAMEFKAEILAKHAAKFSKEAFIKKVNEFLYENKILR